MAVRAETVTRPRVARATRGSRPPLRSPAILITLVTMALVLLGLIMILSASSVSSFANYGSSFLYFKRQLLFAALGIVMFFVTSRVDYHRLRGIGYPAFGLVAILLVAVLIPGIGLTSGGSARWVGLGPFSFQPSELAKLALVLLAAEALSRKPERTLDDFSHTVVPVVPALGVLALLVMAQPDLGTTILLGGIGIGMMFAAGVPLRHLAPVVLLGGGTAVALALSADYRRARILSFLDPWQDPLNSGYQAIQSMIALGSGGWFGVGLGASRQKWSYIPNAHTDFIYSIVGEEMGLFGTLIVLGTFGFLTYLGIRTARRAPDRFGMLIAAGVTIWIATQALVNMGAVTGSLPITGVPLPLVSFGGSSLVFLLTSMGILVNIARHETNACAHKDVAGATPRRRAPSGRPPAKRPRSR